jgi:serine protease Do
MSLYNARTKRLRSPRALMLALAISGLGVGALAFDGESRASQVQLWREGAGAAASIAADYDPRRSLAPLIKAVSPAVVSVKVAGKPRPGLDPRVAPFLPEMAPEAPSGGLGSGFIIAADGLVVTNHHVIDGATAIEVKIADGRVFAARALGSDPHTDLALLRLEGARDLPTVALGRSDPLAVGDWVVAIGSPMGLEQTATTGIVSAKKRGSLGLYQNSYVDFLQTDAAISPGNSGGPLFNLEGEVIAINTAIGGIGRGLGFAVPIDQAKSVLPQLYAKGKVERGWLGIAGRDVEPAVGRAPEPGAVIGEVSAGTPAGKAGLRAGDRILAVDGRAVDSFADLRGRIADALPGSKVTLKIHRDGGARDVVVTLGALPSDDELRRLADPRAADKGGDLYGPGEPRLGAQIEAGGDGLTIKQVRPGSLAADLGLRPGDRLLEINGQKVRAAGEIARALTRDRRRLEVTVQRGQSTHSAVIERR